MSVWINRKRKSKSHIEFVTVTITSTSACVLVPRLKEIKLIMCTVSNMDNSTKMQMCIHIARPRPGPRSARPRFRGRQQRANTMSYLKYMIYKVVGF